MTVPHVGGRPMLFPKPQDLANAINVYFQTTKLEELTVTGLALAIGTSRVVLDDYLRRDGYTEIVSRAKLIIENAYELSLRAHGRSGDIFALKNFGWQDTKDLKVNELIQLDREVIYEVNLTGDS